MRHLLYLSLIMLLSGCLSTNKPHPENTSYDFGLSTEVGVLNSIVEIGQVTAIDAIDHRRIRYRLNYENPSQVFTYSQHRWTTSPADLLASKLRSMVKVSTPSTCSMKIQVEMFDHVFDTASNSTGVVKLHGTIYAKKSREVFANTIVQAAATAPSANAAGGVAALNEASDKAISTLLEWANTAAKDSGSCAQG